MQSVAAEMNLAETAFVLPAEDGVHGLRWFTPTVEVDLCGHATLASAHALWTEGRAPEGSTLRFATRSGELRARREGGLIALDLPVSVPVEAPAPVEMLRALGVLPTRTAEVGGWWLVEVATEGEVRAADPDFRRLAAFPRASSPRPPRRPRSTSRPASSGPASASTRTR
jgi:PhzF family phenazine biosynthesis protein